MATYTITLNERTTSGKALMDYLQALGVLIQKVTPQTAPKPRLYDPETGECLNDKTMKAIEDVRSGKEPVYEMKSMEEFKAWCEAL